MKTITTILISLISLVTVKASNTESMSPATALTVSANNNNVVINWSASNKSRFEIERSFYSNNFTTIAALQIPFATTGVKNFRINDNAAELAGRTIAYYRVKQVDANGTVTYSNTMVVNLNGTEAAPVKKNNMINFTAAQNGSAVITLKGLTGQVASVKNTIISKGTNTVELENLNSLTKGIYTAEVSVNGVVVDTQKVIAE